MTCSAKEISDFRFFYENGFCLSANLSAYICFFGLFKRIFHIVVVGCLSVLLIFGSTAKEFVHLFAHHEDTIHNPHHICPEGEAHFENEHHHCEFLHFVLEPFANDAFVPKISFLKRIAFVQKSYFKATTYIHRSVEYISLRGPPIS